MPRLIKAAAILSVACLLPLMALHAQQPAPEGPEKAPTAKDGVEPKEKAKEQSTSKAKTSNDPIDRIKAEGLERSKVMSTLGELTDVIGPRLTGSPGMRRANLWTRDKLTEWGLENAHLEPWGPFGRGWSLKQFSAQVVEPQCIPLIAYPKAWSPGLDAPLVAPVVHLDAKVEADLAKFKGKLKGVIVLTGPPRTLAARFEPLATRLTDSDLLKLADAPEPSPRGPGRRTPPASGEGRILAAGEGAAPGTGTGSTDASNGTGTGAGSGTQPPPQPRQTSPGGARQADFARKRLQFLIEEGAALLVDPSAQGDGGTLFVASAGVPGPPPGRDGKRISAWDKDAPRTLPQLVVASEHYNRMVRMIERGESLKLAVELTVQFHDDDLMAANTIAEIPGTDLKNEVVMLGGHMDSWHSGTGATDNAAGVAVAMEAVRILKALDLKPRRTIRIALWSGEEQGLLGSKAYVGDHFGKNDDRPGNGAPSASRNPPEPTRKPEYETFSAYYNLDNGTGKIRGVYLQGNEAVRPIFRKWLQPFGEMGARTISVANTGGTDHQSFDGIGLPGFQFIQDWVEYNTRTHHSNQDLYDRIQADDMKQASIIMATFVYNTAMRDEKLPRKPATKAVVPNVPVAAVIDTTLSTASGQIRQFAFDGDAGTSFASEQNPSAADHFTLVLDQPVTLKSIDVSTGRVDRSDRLEAGALETSSDGTTFAKLANLVDGSAHGEPEKLEVRAIRIKTESDPKHPLVIREFTIESDPPVANFSYPIEFVVDASDAPDLKEWAEKAAKECERSYPMINQELKGENFKPPHLVTMTLKSNYRGVAAAHRDHITGSARYFKEHPDDVGALIHETAHIVQQYRGRDNPSWLVEGVADYVRFFKYEPGKIGPINAERARYNSSYRVTAAFLAYLSDRYDKEIVLKLNTVMRQGEYKEEIFQELTGKSLQELGEEWRSTLH